MRKITLWIDDEDFEELEKEASEATDGYAGAVDVIEHKLAPTISVIGEDEGRVNEDALPAWLKQSIDAYLEEFFRDTPPTP